jgi:hypothetical protein
MSSVRGRNMYGGDSYRLTRYELGKISCREFLLNHLMPPLFLFNTLESCKKFTDKQIELGNFKASEVCIVLCMYSSSYDAVESTFSCEGTVFADYLVPVELVVN